MITDDWPTPVVFADTSDETSWEVPVSATPTKAPRMSLPPTPVTGSAWLGAAPALVAGAGTLLLWPQTALPWQMVFVLPILVGAVVVAARRLGPNPAWVAAFLALAAVALGAGLPAVPVLTAGYLIWTAVVADA